MGNKLDEPKTSVKWKINLKMKVNFMSSKDNDDKQWMHSKSNNIVIIIGNETDEIINEIFETLFTWYQRGIYRLFSWFDKKQKKQQKIQKQMMINFFNTP